MSEDLVVAEEPLDRKGVAEQRITFLGILEESCKSKAAVSLRFHGPGVEGVKASGTLLAVESSLDEILVENLKTPTGELPVARVNLDDVLYIKVGDAVGGESRQGGENHVP